MEKHVYLVRHGESEENASRIHRGPDAALTDLGRQQASAVAERFARMDVDAVVSSSFTRAVDTAHSIAVRIGKNAEQNALLGEWLPPSRVIGLHRGHPEVEVVFNKFYASRDPHYRYGDEETFAEVVVRSNAALNFFENHDLPRLCIVTHGLFLRVLVGTMIFGDSFTTQQFHSMREHVFTTNAGITYIRRTEEGIWKLITWNDQSHFG